MLNRRIALLAAGLALTASAGGAVPGLANPSMTEGDRTVAGWRDAEADEGSVRAVRDAKDFAAGPASLRLESVGGPVKGGKVALPLEGVKPGDSFGIRGRAKAAGAVTFAAVAVVTPRGKENWHQVASFATFAGWGDFQGNVTVPDGAESAVLILLMHGEGKIWLDELRVVPAEQIKQTAVVCDFNQAPTFAYLSFDKNVSVADGVLHVTSKDGKGGVGFVTEADLSRYGDRAPAAWLKTGPKNRAKQIKVLFTAGEAKRMFTYPLDEVGREEFVRVLPEHGLALSPKIADEPDQSFDPAKVNTVQVQGNWKAAAIDLFVDRIELVPATGQMKAARAAHAERLAKVAERKRAEAERRRQEIARVLAGADHPENGPAVVHLCAVTPDMLAVQIQSGEIVCRPQVPYEPQEGDEVVPAKGTHDVLQWRDGKIADAPKGVVVKRAVKGKRKEVIGSLVVNEDLLAPGPAYRGTPMTHVTAGERKAYLIASEDDPAFREPTHPEAVHLKCKPNGQAGGSAISVRYHVYLKLATPLKPGATYTVHFRGVNTRAKTAAYTHEPRKVRSEAVHVTQVGYRPSDPFKRAYLSLWTGTGGKVSYGGVTSFELLDAGSGETAHRGKVRMGFAADRTETIRGGRNQVLTDVYYLDFHGFDRPGTYRVLVPGIGTSFPFEIAEDVWARAFGLSMHGLLCHRSGIALGKPFTEYERPRPMHPADGFAVFRLDTTFWNGESSTVHRTLRRMLGKELDASKLRTHDGAWGGYMDAGDWDRRSQHLTVTWSLLELADLFGEHFADVRLALPPGEATDGIPDLLNEAMWNLDLYRRLQRPDGGVGGGVESTSHPRPGEGSWQESLLVGTFAPDPESSLRYAACAARAARLLEGIDKQLAATYAETAAKAWTWANANEETCIAAESKARGSRGGKDPDRLRDAVRNARALAAVALYRLTGKQTYHDAFKAATLVSVEGADAGKQVEPTFAYACLAEDKADAELKAKMVAWIEAAAKDSLKFAAGNAFSITTRAPLLPVMGYTSYYSVPETSIGPVLTRAHYLTGKAEYLRGALAAAQFPAGANPMNMTLTTGLGRRFPRHPLHIDSRNAGLDVPGGITVYGINDPKWDNGAVNWAHTWYMHSKVMVPSSRTWPSTEFYVDLGNWPPTNEYTVHQSIGPTAYYWGYLAARGK